MPDHFSYISGYHDFRDDGQIRRITCWQANWKVSLARASLKKQLKGNLMSKKPEVSKRTLEHKGTKGTVEVSQSKSVFSGAWLCNACGDSNGVMGISKSFQVTDMLTETALKTHIDQTHPE